jgi:putative membrane protein insertion efficiency factor
LSESKIRLRGWAATALIAPIRLYRAFLSPLFPPACRFQPSCSQYAIEAIATHGALKGLALAARRLARCHPISWLGGSSGFDPVPPR